jgi:hypothetical protein
MSQVSRARAAIGAMTDDGFVLVFLRHGLKKLLYKAVGTILNQCQWHKHRMAFGGFLFR